MGSRLRWLAHHCLAHPLVGLLPESDRAWRLHDRTQPDEPSATVLSLMAENRRLRAELALVRDALPEEEAEEVP